MSPGASRVWKITLFAVEVPFVAKKVRRAPNARAAMSCACAITPFGSSSESSMSTDTDRSARSRFSPTNSRKPAAHGLPSRLSPDECPGVCQASLAISTYSRSASKNGVRDFSWISACTMRNQPRGSTSSRMKKPSTASRVSAPTVSSSRSLSTSTYRSSSGRSRCSACTRASARHAAASSPAPPMPSTSTLCRSPSPRSGRERLGSARDAAERQAAGVVEAAGCGAQALEQVAAHHRVGNDEQDVAVRAWHAGSLRE